MPESDIQELKNKMSALHEDMKENIGLTRAGFERMNGRLKKLELKNAYREGVEKATAVVAVSGDEGWKKATFKLMALISAMIALGSAAAVVAGKALGQ